MTIFVQQGNEKKELTFTAGQTLLEILREAGYEVSAPCGGNGTCGKCTVYIGGEAHLACQTEAADGMVVGLPHTAELEVALGSDAVFACDSGLQGYGVAVDIGTTTVACHLVNLENGKTVAVAGEGNAQRSYGADVISRIQASVEGRLGEMAEVIRKQLGEMMESLCREAKVSPAEVRFMTVAANTTMCHILAGLKPDTIGVAPFTPLSLFGDDYDAKAWGLPFDGRVYLAPSVSGYVGGDITADLLAVDMDKASKPVLLIDVGTNGEMALGCGDKFVCCSTAAGPAFEGAQIRFGMTAAEGAISSVEYHDGALECKVIGGVEAKGICGSGLIDAIAVMLEVGALDETGRVLDVDEDDDIPEEALPFLTLLDDEPAFRLTEQVYVTQSDVRKVQLGKGAIAAGIQVLIDTSDVNYDDIGALLLAGGFGSFIRPASAARIGLIPAELLGVTKAVGNTAAVGAKMALVSAEARQRLDKLQKAMDYQELSGLAAFNTAYMEKMMFLDD